MKITLEGSDKKILQLRRELKKRLRNDDVVLKEVLPEEKKKQVRKKKVNV
jgi:hypothetical protein